MSNVFTNGAVHEFEITGRKVGWENRHLGVLAADVEKCRLVRLFLDGMAEIKVVTHVVNTDELMLPEGYAEERHVRHGNVTLDPARLQLRLEQEQSGGGYLVGHEMSKRLTGRPDVLGYCELQYLYTHQDFIPESWKEVCGVYGWNTIVRGPGGGLYVAYLRWFGVRWYLGFYFLGNGWHRRNPAGLLASL